MKTESGFVENALGKVAGWVVSRPWTVVILYLLLASGCAISAVLWLGLKTAQNALVSNDLEYNQRYHRYRDEFGDQEYIYLVIEVDELRSAMQVADAVADEMEPLKTEGYVKDCIHRLSLDAMKDNALVYLPRPALEALAELARSHGDAVQAALAVDGLPALLREALQIDAASIASHPELARLGLDATETVIAAMHRALDGETAAAEDRDLIQNLQDRFDDPSFAPLRDGWPWLEHAGEFLRQARTRGYLLQEDLLLVLIMPQKDFQTLELIREPLRKIREAVDRVRQQFPDVRMGLTGRPVLQADQMQTTNRDVTRASILAIVGVLALFILFFRGIRRPFLTALVLAHAVAITFGVVTFTIGYLNLLSIVFALMMISLGTEFGIHVIARYQQELTERRDVAESLRITMTTAGRGNITGGLTTAAAFYTTLLVDFKGLSELGFIAGTGIIICMTSMNTLLPALLLLTDRWRLPRGTLQPLRMTLLARLTRRPVSTLGLCGLLLVAGVPALLTVRFNSNLLELQADGLRSVDYEKLIISRAGIKTWFGAYLAPSLEEVRRLVSELSEDRNAGVVGKVESVLDYVPDDQDERLALIRSMAKSLGVDPDAEEARDWPDVAPKVDIESLRPVLDDLRARLQLSVAATSLTRSDSAPRLVELQAAVERLLDKLERAPEEAAERLGDLQTSWFATFHRGAGTALGLLKATGVSTDTLPPFLRRRVLSTGGKYLVYAYPAKDIWNEKNLEEFFNVSHAVDPNVTGRPEQIYQSTALMKRGFVLAALYSLAVVFLLLCADFRGIRDPLLAMVPVLLGLIWTFELMGLLGMSFNLANFFSIPIVIGNGINGGVHIIHRLREDPAGDVIGKSTGTAVTLSALTTITGFGMLLLAQHRGMASLGSVMVLGSIASLFGSVIALPVLLKVLDGIRARGKDSAR